MKKIYIILLAFAIVLSGCNSTSYEPSNSLYPDFNEAYDVNDFKVVSDIEDIEATDGAYYMNSYLNVEDQVLYSKTNFNHTFKYATNEIYLNFYTNTYSNGSLSNIDVKEIKINGETVEYVLEGETLENLKVVFENEYAKGDTINIRVTYAFKYLSEERDSNFDPRMSSHKGPASIDFVSMFYYPIVAMRNDSGWQTDRHSDTGEVYYNDVRDYNVQITTPSNYILAHSGLLTNKTEKNDLTTHEIYLRDGRDFSFSASPDYSVSTKEIDGVVVNINTMINLGSKEDEIFDIVRDMFAFNGEYIGEYIYDSLTLEFGHIYGMESTSVVYCAKQIDYVTLVHEIYHQWFYSMIGSNQGDDPWLDEGLTTFATGLFFNAYPEYYNGSYFEDYNVNKPRLVERFEPIYGKSVFRGMDAYRGEGAREYGFYDYWYPTTVFYQYMNNVLDMDAAPIYDLLSTHYDKNLNKVADPDEFFVTMDETLGEEATAWFKDYFSNAREIVFE